MAMADIMIGLFIPFAGTALGAAGVYCLRGGLNETVRRLLTGFAAGVMTAAAVWSLLLPAMEQASHMGPWAFVPAVSGFWLGVAVLLALDRLVPHLHLNSDEPEGPHCGLPKTTMLVLAVMLHNIPEGMAVGIVYAGYMTGQEGLTLAGALALSLGIAIQNFPEGAIISMPLRAAGWTAHKAFAGGLLSGIVEPIGAAAAIALTSIMMPVLPYLLSLSAGAMMYVVVEELIPAASSGRHSNVGALSFSLGFTVMMALDTALG